MAPSSATPRLDEPVRRLMYVGPLFAGRARDQYHIRTMRQLRDHMQAQSRAQNRQFLAEWLENPRRGECVPPPLQRRKYSVRPFNEYAFDSVVRYMSRRMPVHERQRVPAPLRPRPRRISHPRRCRV